jgi:endonuclease/exonuclease/phosphatase (EEP) superfamily protein YafD
VRRLLSALLVLALGILVLLTVSRVIETRVRWLILAASFSPYAVLGYALVLVICLIAVWRARGGTVLLIASVVALTGLVIHAVWLAPLLFGGQRPGGASLVVMTSNLDAGHGDPRTIMAAVRDDQVDVLVLEEVTPTFLARLRLLNVDALLPEQSGAPSLSDTGTMVFSRYPLSDSQPLPLSKGGQSVQVSAPHSFTLLVVHTSQPVKHPAAWAQDLQTIRTSAASAVRSGNALVVGDFNATRDHQQFRDVLHLGLRDAAEQAGSGWQPTWPTRDWDPLLRPLISIDHVLATRGFTAVRTRTVEPEDSDHLALIAELTSRGQ